MACASVQGDPGAAHRQTEAAGLAAAGKNSGGLSLRRSRLRVGGVQRPSHVAEGPAGMGRGCDGPADPSDSRLGQGTLP